MFNDQAVDDLLRSVAISYKPLELILGKISSPAHAGPHVKVKL